MITIIVAVSQNNTIGKDNKLLWNISDDLKRFKKLTLNNPIIMGRKTFDSLPGVLPNRVHIVISKQKNKSHENKNVIFVDSLEKAIEKAENINQNIFIIGGGTIYNQAINIADKLEITKVHVNIQGDTFFPELNFNNWKLLKQEDFFKSEKNEYDFSFLTYEKLIITRK